MDTFDDLFYLNNITTIKSLSIYLNNYPHSSCPQLEFPASRIRKRQKTNYKEYSLSSTFFCLSLLLICAMWHGVSNRPNLPPQQKHWSWHSRPGWMLNEEAFSGITRFRVSLGSVGSGTASPSVGRGYGKAGLATRIW